MEKRRRARINDCLLQLKSMLLDAMKRDVSFVLYHSILTFVYSSTIVTSKCGLVYLVVDIVN